MRLRKSCHHDRYEPHALVTAMHRFPQVDCPGGEIATLEDLVSALNELGAFTCRGSVDPFDQSEVLPELTGFQT